MSEEIVEEKKSGKGLLIAVIAVLVVLIIAIAFVVVLLLGGEKEVDQAPVQAPAKERPKFDSQSDYTRLGPTFTIPEPFVVNLAGEDGRRYLKTSISFEMSAQELEKELTTKLPSIKETIIYSTSSKTFEDISTPKGKDRLKEEIAQKLNASIVDGYIKRVIFTEFVIQ